MQGRNQFKKLMMLECASAKDECDIFQQLQEWEYCIAGLTPGEKLPAAASSNKSTVLLIVFGFPRPDAGKLRCLLQSYQELSCFGIFHTGTDLEDHHPEDHNDLKSVRFWPPRPAHGSGIYRPPCPAAHGGTNRLLS